MLVMSLFFTPQTQKPYQWPQKKFKTFSRSDPEAFAAQLLIAIPVLASQETFYVTVDLKIDSSSLNFIQVI